MGNNQNAELANAAMLGETTWRECLDELAAATTGSAGLVVHDASNGDGYALWSTNIQQAARNYSGHYAGVNVLQAMLADKPVGYTGIDDELLPREELASTPFFREFLLPNGLAHTGGVKLHQIDSQSFSLIAGQGANRPTALRRALATLQAMAPHVRRAFEFHRHQASRRHGMAQEVANLVRGWSRGIVLVDDRLRVTGASHSAASMIANDAPLHIAHSGRLRFRNKAAQNLCEKMLRRSYQGPESVDLHSHGMRITLNRVRKSPELLYFEGACAAIVLERPDAAPAYFNAHAFAAANGLSRGEMRSLAGLMDGHSAHEIALRANRSIETIRTQIKSLYAKLGAHSAADVLRLIQRWTTG